MKDVTDGLSNTLLRAKKHVMAVGDGYATVNTGADSCQSGDTCIYDNSFGTTTPRPPPAARPGSCRADSTRVRPTAIRWPVRPTIPPLRTSDHMKLFGLAFRRHVPVCALRRQRAELRTEHRLARVGLSGDIKTAR